MVVQSGPLQGYVPAHGPDSDMTAAEKKSAVRQINRRLNEAEHQLKLHARNSASGMSEGQAAAKIQAGFRKYNRAKQARPPLSSSRQVSNQARSSRGPVRTTTQTSLTRPQAGRGANTWRQNVANPFSLDVAKYPGLDIGPLSNAIGTLDITTTSSPLPQGSTLTYTDQSIVIQWSPGLTRPASEAVDPSLRAQTSLTSVMGSWVTLAGDGTVLASEGIFAEKFKGMGGDVKKARMLKAGIQCHVQQPRHATGGYCYMNKGPDALLCLSGPDAQGNTPATFYPLQIGKKAYIEAVGGQFPVATKANLASQATATAMTISEKLCDHDDFPLVSTPYDAVKAADFKPYDVKGSNTFNPTGTEGFNTNLADPIWSPGWMIFQPTFSTSTAPDKIVANIQLHVWSAWEILPYAGTYAHISRTDAAQATSMQQMQTPKPSMLNDFFGALRRGAEWGIHHVPQIVGGVRSGMKVLEGLGPLAAAF